MGQSNNSLIDESLKLKRKPRVKPPRTPHLSYRLLRYLTNEDCWAHAFLAYCTAIVATCRALFILRGGFSHKSGRSMHKWKPGNAVQSELTRDTCCWTNTLDYRFVQVGIRWLKCWVSRWCLREHRCHRCSRLSTDFHVLGPLQQSVLQPAALLSRRGLLRERQTGPKSRLRLQSLR